MSPDTISEMIAFWGSLIASVYFFKKGKKTLGWIFAIGVVGFPAIVGFFFVVTGAV